MIYTRVDEHTTPQELRALMPVPVQRAIRRTTALMCSLAFATLAVVAAALLELVPLLLQELRVPGSVTTIFSPYLLNLVTVMVVLLISTFQARTHVHTLIERELQRQTLEDLEKQR